MGTKLNRKGRVSLPVALAASSMLALALTLSSCSGEDGKNGKDGTGTSCTLDGKVLTCGDKTLTIKDGEDGEPGGAGPKGETGIPCTLEQDEEGKGPAVITCGDKTLVIPMCDGDIYSLAKNVCDNDGNLYDIVKIGAQTWMAEDLKGGTADKFTWAQATAGVCPSGWSLPSKEDFDTLIDSGETEKWDTSTSYEWWSSSTVANNENNARILSYEDDLSISSYPKTTAISVRCLKD